MGQLITINDSNWMQFVDPVVDGETKKCRTFPRNRTVYGPGIFAPLIGMWDQPLIPESEWDDRVAQQEKDKSSLQHVRDRGGPGGKPIPSRDQNGVGYCWCHSGVSAHLLARGVMGEPYEDLSPFSIGCMIKNYRDEGGWGGEGVKFQAERGCATSEFWPQRSMSRSNDKPETWTNAGKFKYVKWLECSNSSEERKRQIITATLLGWPVVADFNWWSHSVCIARVMSRTKTRIWNSWGDSWSDNGFGDLEGGKAWPDDAWVCQVVSASA